MMRMNLPAMAALLAVGAATAVPAQGAAPERHGLVARWTFDGHLRDVSGRGNHAVGAGVTYGHGRDGRALTGADEPLTVSAAPELDLFPGFTIRCRVRFDTAPEGYVELLRREGAYILRVDAPGEGGNLSFFVNLNGWEPRLRGPVPEPGVWYDIEARWDGKEMTLDVNGNRKTARRTGTPVPAAEPLTIGAGGAGRLDDLTILNPGHVDRQWALGATESIGTRLTRTAFGRGAGWQGWRGDRGAVIDTFKDRTLSAGFSGAGAALVQPGLDVDIARLPYVLVDAGVADDVNADLLFVTTEGYGLMPFRLYGSSRTSAVLMAHHPGWRGRLRLLALVPRRPDAAGDPLRVKLRSVRLSEHMDGNPFLYVRGVAPGRAILRAGRDEEMVCVVRNVGGPAPEVTCTLAVPAGVWILGEATRKMRDVAHDATLQFRWPVRAERPCEGVATVTARAPDGDRIRDGPYVVSATVTEQSGPGNTALLGAGILVLVLVLGGGWWWLRR